jgi:hypothetical protein
MFIKAKENNIQQSSDFAFNINAVQYLEPTQRYNPDKKTLGKTIVHFSISNIKILLNEDVSDIVKSYPSFPWLEVDRINNGGKIYINVYAIMYIRKLKNGKETAVFFANGYSVCVCMSFDELMETSAKILLK